ncbi:hypothetical protein C5167_012132 [Papaver somniferum]|uniref:Uncharacterized protein n=1 Tax=Papaver somniferum TaxID=3469 RepID=A0A4Y7J0J3_PAPSO|nr:hypothetical protein C5167_012132 [Papaver somniferum]
MGPIFCQGQKITAPPAQVDRLNKEGDLVGELGNEIKPKDKMDEMLERLLQQQHQDQIDASLKKKKKKGQLWCGLIGGLITTSRILVVDQEKDPHMGPLSTSFPVEDRISPVPCLVDSLDKTEHIPFVKRISDFTFLLLLFRLFF